MVLGADFAVHEPWGWRSKSFRVTQGSSLLSLREEVGVNRRATVELVLDRSDPQGLMGFWQEALNYRVHFLHRSLAVLVPQDDMHGLPLLLQRVPEPKAGKNRMHMDIVTEGVEVEVHRLETLGARRLHHGIRSFGPVRWVTMADPGDNEFCMFAPGSTGECAFIFGLGRLPDGDL